MKFRKVKDLFDIVKGRKLKKVETPHQATARYIQIEDLRDDSNLKFCEVDENTVLVNKEDIIIAWDGANAGTIGFGLNGAIGSTLAVLKLKDNVGKEKIDSHYVARFLKSKERHLRDNCTGATIPHISRNVLENINIPLPSIDTQKKINSILNRVEKVIKLRKEQISALSSLKQSIFLDMFGDPLLNSKKYPKAKLGDLCKVVRGGSPRPIKDFLGGTIPWIKISDGTKEDSIYITETKEKIIEEGIKKSRLVPKGSLIFANCGVSLGFARIITFDGCIHDGWLAFQDISDKLNDIFLLNLLNFFTKHFRSTAPDGTQPNLNTTILKNFEVILPSIGLQNEYAEFITSLEGKNRKLVESLKELENLKDALSNKAFNGELFND
ncbi:MAG: restriction endonuclease subunit S [Bacillaceae bacterium]|nr:restriction endonuclease subunit S [Bacillaceae bacterium]